MLELKRMWHPVFIGEAILNIYQNRITSTLTGFKICPSFVRLIYTTKDLSDTKQSSQPMITPHLHSTTEENYCDFLYYHKNKCRGWQRHYTRYIPSHTVPQNGLRDMKGLIAAFNYTQLTLMGVNIAATSTNTLSTLAEHQL